MLSIDELNASLRERAAAIRLLVLDVDGVLTDGRFTLDHEGREGKTFHTQDGYGIRRLIESGVAVALITGRSSRAVSRRAEELAIAHVMQGCRDKRSAITALLGELGVEREHAAAVGDDMPDLPMFEATGLAFAPANAVAEIRIAADLVTSRRGGDGAVREIADLLLAARRASG